MTSATLTRLRRLLGYIAFGIIISAPCFADESTSAVFLDSTKSIEARLNAIKALKPEELKASPEQLIAILGDQKLPDDIRCFATTVIQHASININRDHQEQINKISTNILQNNEDGGEKLKLSILLWIYTRGTFGVLRGLPTVPPAAMKSLLASEDTEIRKKAIRFIREDDSTFAEELLHVLKGKPLGKVTTLEALEGLSYWYSYAPFNKEALIPLLKNDSLAVSTLAAQQLARTDERDYYHEKLRLLLADAETPTALKLATMEAMTSSLRPNNNALYPYTVSLNQIVNDKNSTPELKQTALIQLWFLIKDHPPNTIHKEITGSLYALHLSYLKPDPEGILFEAVDRENTPKWAEYLEPIYTHLVRNYPEFMKDREARRLVAEQNELKKKNSMLHDKSQTPLVRHQMLTTVGRRPEEAARFAVDPENDEKMRVRAIESLLREIYQKQNELDPELERFAKVVKQVSEEKTDSPAKSRAIQFKESIRKQYPLIFTKIFPEEK